MYIGFSIAQNICHIESSLYSQSYWVIHLRCVSLRQQFVLNLNYQSRRASVHKNQQKIPFYSKFSLEVRLT